MKKLIARNKDTTAVNRLISIFPVTAILGPRQCGKTVLARQIKYTQYFDLENPRDLAKLENPQLTLENLKGLVVIDEIQRMPSLFPLIRWLVDTNPEQKYLILGSASKELVQQSAESLAGRIGYHYLGGFNIFDIGIENRKKLWLRGGFPRAFLSKNTKASFLWLQNYISTFLERDIPQLGINIPANTLRRFWTMVSHYHGQIINYSELGRSFGITDVTVKKYLHILEGTFMIRLLQPWYTNTKKRLVKRPKLYFKDSGLFHSLISIETAEQLNSHIKLGASWEGFALEYIAKNLGKRDEELYFWATHSGAELDLFWQDKGKNWGVDFKFKDAPRKTKSMQIAIRDLRLEHLWVIYPGKESYQLSSKITVLPLQDIHNLFTR
jgi:predicted AAA+ superfamily ATPase